MNVCSQIRLWGKLCWIRGTYTMNRVYNKHIYTLISSSSLNCRKPFCISCQQNITLIYWKTFVNYITKTSEAYTHTALHVGIWKAFDKWAPMKTPFIVWCIIFCSTEKNVLNIWNYPSMKIAKCLHLNFLSHNIIH